MKFTRISDWAELSDCKGYSVSAAKVGAQFKFQAWRWNGEREMQILLGTFDDAQGARERCSDDLAERKGEAA